MARETKRKKNRIWTLPSGKLVMRASIVISVFLHLCILLIIQEAFPINWVMKPMRTYEVDLIRPPIDPLDEEKPEGADLAKIKPDEKTPPEETEDTISLDTKDKRYGSYARVIKEALMRQWQYPRQAMENLIEGKLQVLFSLSREGHLIGIQILDPSGHDILDQEALRSVRSAAPFPPFPGSVTVSKLHITANFEYRLGRH